jgi:hypothetical protein
MMAHKAWACNDSENLFLTAKSGHEFAFQIGADNTCGDQRSILDQEVIRQMVSVGYSSGSRCHSKASGFASSFVCHHKFRNSLNDRRTSAVLFSTQELCEDSTKHQMISVRRSIGKRKSDICWNFIDSQNAEKSGSLAHLSERESRANIRH